METRPPVPMKQINRLIKLISETANIISEPEIRNLIQLDVKADYTTAEFVDTLCNFHATIKHIKHCEQERIQQCLKV